MVCIGVICVISERLQSASGAVTVQIRALPFSMIEDRAERENGGAGIFLIDYARIMRARVRAEIHVTFLPT